MSMRFATEKKPSWRLRNAEEMVRYDSDGYDENYKRCVGIEEASVAQPIISTR